MLVTRSGQSVKSVLLAKSLCKYFKEFFRSDKLPIT